MSTQPTRIPPRERLRTVREAPVNQQYAARFLNLHPKTVLRKAREGSLPAHPVGTCRKRWHFYLSELDHWLRSQVISGSHFKHLLRSCFEVDKKKDSFERKQQMRLVRFLYEYVLVRP